LFDTIAGLRHQVFVTVVSGGARAAGLAARRRCGGIGPSASPFQVVRFVYFDHRLGHQPVRGSSVNTHPTRPTSSAISSAISAAISLAS